MIHVKPQKNLTLDEWFVHIMAPKNWNSEERGFEILNATAAIFRFFIWENRLPLLPAWWCPVGWFDFDVFANFYWSMYCTAAVLSLWSKQTISKVCTIPQFPIERSYKISNRQISPVHFLKRLLVVPKKDTVAQNMFGWFSLDFKFFILLLREKIIEFLFKNLSLFFYLWQCHEF